MNLADLFYLFKPDEDGYLNIDNFMRLLNVLNIDIRKVKLDKDRYNLNDVEDILDYSEINISELGKIFKDTLDSKTYDFMIKNILNKYKKNDKISIDDLMQFLNQFDLF